MIFWGTCHLNYYVSEFSQYTCIITGISKQREDKLWKTLNSIHKTRILVFDKNKNTVQYIKMSICSTQNTVQLSTHRVVFIYRTQYSSVHIEWHLYAEHSTAQYT